METKDTFLEKPRQELEKKNNEFHLSSCSMIKRPKNTYKTETEDQHSFCFKKSKKKKEKKRIYHVTPRNQVILFGYSKPKFVTDNEIDSSFLKSEQSVIVIILSIANI